MINKLLSPQQTIVLQFLVNGKTIKEIATCMGLQKVTVRKHFNRARAKLGTFTHDQTVAVAVARGEVVVTVKGNDESI